MIAIPGPDQTHTSSTTGGSLEGRNFSLEFDSFTDGHDQQDENRDTDDCMLTEAIGGTLLSFIPCTNADSEDNWVENNSDKSFQGRCDQPSMPITDDGRNSLHHSSC